MVGLWRLCGGSGQERHPQKTSSTCDECYVLVLNTGILLWRQVLQCPRMPVLSLSSISNDCYVHALAQSGCCSGVQVLDLPKNANSEQLARAYRIKMREAKGDEEATSRIEAAHTSLMMKFFTKRMQVACPPYPPSLCFVNCIVNY
jgi:hypothetical protein